MTDKNTASGARRGTGCAATAAGLRGSAAILPKPPEPRRKVVTSFTAITAPVAALMDVRPKTTTAALPYDQSISQAIFE